jgi:hypothetical protein
MDLQWWITVIEIPALAGLFWLEQSNRSAVDRAIESIRNDVSNWGLLETTKPARGGLISE